MEENNTEVTELANTTEEEVVETQEAATETPKTDAKPEKTPLVILDAQTFMNEVGKLVGQIPEGKTLEGFYNYFYSAMKAKYLESVKKRTNGALMGTSNDVVAWVQKYFSDDVKEGDLVPEPSFNGGLAMHKPAEKKPKTQTPEEIAKKAAKDAEKAKKEAEKKAKEEMKKKWQQQSFDFFARYGV